MARITIGDKEDSKARFKKVKHSISSIWTWKGGKTVKSCENQKKGEGNKKEDENGKKANEKVEEGNIIGMKTYENERKDMIR